MKIKQNGDTIVEVLVAIVVAGLALAVAYQLSNASLRTSTSSSLRSQALAVNSSQIERLKAIYYSYPDRYAQAKSDVDFCIGQDGTVYTWSVANCSVDGTPFLLKDHYNSSTMPNTAGTFSFTLTWPNLNNHGTDSQVLYYRLAT